MIGSRRPIIRPRTLGLLDCKEAGMGRFISTLCCLIVGLQVLIGVPLAVCVAFLMAVHDGRLGTIEISFRAATEQVGEQAILPLGPPVVKQEMPVALPDVET